MPIIYARSSPKRLEVFKNGLLELADLGRLVPNLAVDPNPLPIYNVNVRNLADKVELVDVAKLVAWRYSALRGDEVEVTGDVSDALPYALNSIQFASEVKVAQSIRLSLLDAPELQGQDYQLRFVRIPGALEQGYWLKPATGPAYFRSLNAGFNPVSKQQKLAPAHDFLRAIRPVQFDASHVRSAAPNAKAY